MKIYIVILLFIPCALLAQNTKVMTTQDVLINAVLETTTNYLKHKNDVDQAEHLEFKTKKYSIDWNNKQLIKW